MTVDFVPVYDTVYALVIHPGKIERGGQRLDTYVDHPTETILVSDTLPLAARMAAAAQAVSLAWGTFQPSPSLLVRSLPFVSAED
jgi:hypothetical protein